MKNLLFILSLLFFISCGNKKTDEAIDATTFDVVEPETEETPTETNIAPATKTYEPKDIIGNYVGMFRADIFDEAKKPSWANKISLSIDKIDGDKVEGHSVVAGNDRPFSGLISEYDSDEGVFEISVKEPGDDKYDGEFNFNVSPKKNQAEGFWDANDNKLAVTRRKYKLEKKEFKYDPELSLDDMNYVELYGTYNDHTGESEMVTGNVANKNPSTEELTKADVENMHKGDLEVMRNAIYARHGYSFKNRKMRYVFNFVDWYVPHSTDIRDKLTDIEKKNIDLMKRYEQHAERYYDSFGR